MPIRGLTDRGLSFPQIGIIRKGSPKQTITRDNKEIQIQGKDLQFFRVVFDENEVAASETFKEIYGDKPTQIKIVFPFNEVERVWDAWLEAYTASRLLARSDGETVIYWRKDGRVLAAAGRATVTEEIEIAIRIAKEKYEKRKLQLVEGSPIPYIDGMVFGGTAKTPGIAKPVGRLRVVIPDLHRLATLTFMTTSKRDIIAMGGGDSGELGSIVRVCQSVRVPFAGVPLILKRRKEEVSVPQDDGSAKRLPKWMVHIEPDPEFVARANIAMHRLAMPKIPLLDIPEEEDEDIDVPAEPVMNGDQSRYDELKEAAKDDPTSAFWSLTKIIDMDEETAKQVLKECGGEFKGAFERLAEQYKEILT
jgi:recombination directionality factor gp3-like protein